MSQNENKNAGPLARQEPWNLVADGYAVTTMVAFQQWAEAAIGAAKLPRNARILDVACGPGTVSLMVARDVESVHGIDFSAPMIEIFRAKAVEQGLTNITLHCSDAQSLPYPDATFDAAFSLFGLMFFPDRSKGFAEIHRTLKPGGRAIVTSWAPVDESPAMQLMFGAVRAIKPELPEPKRSIGTLEDPAVFRAEMEQAGFRDVEITRVTRPYAVRSVSEFWEFMVKGSAPIIMLRKSLGEDVWKEKEQLALDFLASKLPELPTELTSDAWLGVGTK